MPMMERRWLRTFASANGCTPGVAGRALVLRIEPPAASRPLGFHRWCLRAILRCALRLPSGTQGEGQAAGSLQRITPFSSSRSARTLCACVHAAVFEP